MWYPHLFLLFLHSAFCYGLPVWTPIVSTSLGKVRGASLAGSERFTLPFAQPPLGSLRFAAPQPVERWNATFDGSRTPASCMQTADEARGGNAPNEDCLYLTLYRPSWVRTGSKLSVMVWVHGGSFVSGSSTASGLDGSGLASEHGVIVVLVQYRLGAFGFLHTDATLDESALGADATKVPGNQAVRDVVQSLQFLRDHVAEFGGNPTSITVAGQSSGAHMVRTLLALPTAGDLFDRAILHSDPANYGPASRRSNGEMGGSVASALGCFDDVACLRSKTADEVLQASQQAFVQVPQQDGSIAQGEPWRPFVGSYLPTPDSWANKPIIITTVANEAGAQVGTMLQPTAPDAQTLQLATLDASMSAVQFPPATVLDMVFNAGRGDKLAASPAYTFSGSEHDALRIAIETVATDGLYRCASWRSATAGAKAYLAIHHTGTTYASNRANAYCMQVGKVCHEDDIYPLFGTAPRSTSARQRRYADEIRQRWMAFVKTANPNTGRYRGWNSLAGSDAGKVGLLSLGVSDDGSSRFEQTQLGVCKDLWGTSVQFDWQMYTS